MLGSFPSGQARAGVDRPLHFVAGTGGDHLAATVATPTAQLRLPATCRSAEAMGHLASRYGVPMRVITSSAAGLHVARPKLHAEASVWRHGRQARELLEKLRQRRREYTLCCKWSPGIRTLRDWQDGDLGHLAVR